MSFLRRLFGCESGTASIETIIVLPIALSLMAGGVEFGQIWSEYGTIAKSVRDSTRYLARLKYDAICDWGLTNAKNMAVYGSINGTTPVISNFSTNDVTLVTPDCGAAPAGGYSVEMRASVSYTGTMLSVIGLDNTFTITVTHEEPHVGD
jgi:Flp pilus assembly protein TadG